jgi:hypothetical protein
MNDRIVNVQALLGLRSISARRSYTTQPQTKTRQDERGGERTSFPKYAACGRRAPPHQLLQWSPRARATSSPVEFGVVERDDFFCDSGVELEVVGYEDEPARRSVRVKDVNEGDAEKRRAPLQPLPALHLQMTRPCRPSYNSSHCIPSAHTNATRAGEREGRVATSLHGLGRHRSWGIGLHWEVEVSLLIGSLGYCTSVGRKV